MMTMADKEKRQTLNAAPGIGTSDLILRRQRQSGKGRLRRIGRRSVRGFALAGCMVIALGMTWALGLVGCTPTAGSSRMEATSGAFFPNSRQSPLEVSRLLRNAHYYKLMGRPELALKELEQAYQQNPDNLKLVDALAQSYQELGQFESARKIYQEALTKQGPHPALANNLCFTYYLEGRFQEAETCYRQTLARDPGNEAARNNLGLLYCRLGRTDEARRLWQEAEGLAAADYKARQALAALGMADRPVYAQKTEPAAVAALSAATPEATQKVAMQLPPPPAQEIPVPALDKPLDEVQEQPEPAKAGSERGHGAVAARRPTPAPDVQEASLQTPVAAVSPPPPSAPSPLHVAPAPESPQKVAQELAPLPALERQVPNIHGPLVQAQPKPEPEQAKPSPAPAAQPASRPAPLTVAELLDTAIEVRNGTPAPHLARDIRSMLSHEAFTVTVIGNHVDFGAAKTIIYYRPEAQRVAQALHTEIFPTAALEP
jgi:Tfp pilus assembly protein PilF